MDKIGIRTIIVNFDDEQLPYLSLVQGDAKTRGFDIVICDSDGKEIPPSDDYIVELVATGSNAPDKPYANRHMIKDGKYRVMIPTEALSKSGFVFLQLVFYQKSTGAVIHTIEQKCPVYKSRGQEVVESNNLYVDITALRLGLERIDELDSRYESMLGEEKIRQDAEDKRNLDEAIRKDNEEIRKANEIKRENNEVIRIDNENNRIIAEEERGIKFDSWDKTMEGIIPNATDTEKGVVKIDKTEGEEAPHTVPTIGKLEEIINRVTQEQIKNLFKTIPSLALQEVGTSLQKVTIWEDETGLRYKAEEVGFIIDEAKEIPIKSTTKEISFKAISDDDITVLLTDQKEFNKYFRLAKTGREFKVDVAGVEKIIISCINNLDAKVKIWDWKEV